MGVFGDRLRREREMRGVTLQEIADSTKISSRLLKAVEDEAFDRLPGGIFNKGFVRAYARFLGLDQEEAVADFLAAEAEARQAAQGMTGSTVVDPENEAQAQSSQLGMRLGLAAIVLLAIIFAGWWWLHRAPRSRADKPATSRSTTAPRTQPPPAPLPIDKPKDTEQQPAPTGTTPLQGATQVPDSEKSAGLASISSSPTPSGAVSAAGVFTIQVLAKQEAWVSVTADGLPLFDKVMAASELKSFTAGSQLTLKTGNAGGLEVTFNGKAVPALGRGKEVKTVNFTREGLQP